MNTTRQQIVFLVLAVILLTALFCATCYTRELLFGTMFVISLFALGAFYLFQFGTLGSFTLKALTAEASFIKEKKQEVEKNAEEVARIKAHAEALSVALEQTRKETHDKLWNLHKDMERITELAKPPTLTALPPEIAVVDAGLAATIQFQPSKNAPLGVLEFECSLNPSSESQIVDLQPSLRGGGFTTDDAEPTEITNGRTKARLRYALLTGASPAIVITVSNGCQVTVTGNYCAQEFSIDIESNEQGQAVNSE